MRILGEKSPVHSKLKDFKPTSLEVNYPRQTEKISETHLQFLFFCVKVNSFSSETRERPKGFKRRKYEIDLWYKDGTGVTGEDFSTARYIFM